MFHNDLLSKTYGHLKLNPEIISKLIRYNDDNEPTTISDISKLLKETEIAQWIHKNELINVQNKN